MQLPACRECNGELDRRFEQPYSTLVYRLFATGGRVALAPSERRGVGEWLLKTWLLLRHPEVRYSNPVIDRLEIIRGVHALPQECYSWMVSGAPPPAGLSVWVTPTRDEPFDQHVGPLIPVPTVRADGRVVRFAVHEVTLHGLTVVLAYHPHWEIDHPDERRGRAARMWPPCGRPVELRALGRVPAAELPRWPEINITFRDGTFGAVELPPLTESQFPWISVLVALKGLATSVGR